MFCLPRAHGSVSIGFGESAGEKEMVQIGEKCSFGILERHLILRARAVSQGEEFFPWELRETVNQGREGRALVSQDRLSTRDRKVYVCGVACESWQYTQSSEDKSFQT